LPCLFLKGEPLQGNLHTVLGIGLVARFELLSQDLLAAIFHVMQHGTGDKPATVASARDPIEDA